MLIGKIARSSSHIDYICQVYQPGDVEQVPDPGEYSFGRFVRIAARGPAVIGAIYDTVLMNPSFGTLGPRLSPASDLAVFSPDYLNEKVTLVGIVALGTWGPGDAIEHGVPPQAMQIDTPVETLSPEEMLAFHSDGHGGVRLGYAPLLLAHGSPLARQLLLRTIEQLEALCPAARPQLRVLRAGLAWRTAVEPLR